MLYEKKGKAADLQNNVPPKLELPPIVDHVKLEPDGISAVDFKKMMLVTPRDNKDKKLVPATIDEQRKRNQIDKPCIED